MYDGRLTALRGLASVAVVMFHALLFFKIADYGGTASPPLQLGDPVLLGQQVLLALFNGNAAVLLFFVLSGCVLTMSLQRMPALTPANLASFYVRRGFRIYPALWLSVLLGAASVSIILSARIPGLVTEWNMQAYHQGLTWRALLGGALGVDIRLNQPLWSLTVELFYSLMFPVIFIATRRPVAAGASLVLALVLLASPLDVWFELNLHLLPFVAGAIIPALLRRQRDPLAAGGLCATLAALVAILLLALARPALEPGGWPKPLFLSLETLGAGMLVYLVLDRRIAAGWLDWPFLHRLGEISYSIYLLHFPLLFLLGTAAMHLFPSRYILDHGLLANLLLGLATLAVTLAAAGLAYRAVELPGIAVGKRLAVRIMAPTAAPVGSSGRRS